MNGRAETSKLVLRTIAIQTFNNGEFNLTIANVDNECGTIQSRGQYVLWKQINIKALLGEMWNKYNMFNLVLRTAVKNPGTNVNTFFAHTLWMTGLNFVNRNYSIVTKGLTNETCVGGVNLISGNASQDGNVHHFTGYSAMFRKGNPIVDLSIQLKNSIGTVFTNNDGRIEISQSNGGHFELIFDIYGVKGYEVKPYQTEQQRSVPISYDLNAKPIFNTPNYVL
jgi:hypothetical protein